MMSRYGQSDPVLSEESKLGVFWVSLCQETATQSTIKYKKADGSEIDAIVTREEDKNHPLGWKVVAKPITTTEEYAVTDNREVLFVTGGEVVWENMTEPMKTLPDNRLDIEMQTSKGNAFLVLTTQDEIALTVYGDDKWITYHHDGNTRTGPVKVFCAKPLY